MSPFGVAPLTPPPGTPGLKGWYVAIRGLRGGCTALIGEDVVED